MTEFIKGQRWISAAEPELGLGTITDVEDRRTCVSFLGSNAKRQYATAAAPLKRVRFRTGEQIMSREDVRLRIDSVREADGILIYCGSGHEISEYDICDTISFSTPRERLINGLADPVEIFNLRYETLNYRSRTKKSSVRGFLGGRVDLIGHQFYIADQVAARHVPRVLLSDEVGLGKTIEAGLILHRLLECERIRRVLIIVPESLVHQWFVELWRRFNLMFKIVDDAWIRSAEKCGSGDNPVHPVNQINPSRQINPIRQVHRNNPFSDFQLGIGGMDFFKNNRRRQQALAAGWDMLVVDEAHHIIENSPEYRFIASLGQASNGMMLLTATPDQMGERSHFARLRLLDPPRYHDYEAFTQYAGNYRKIAELTDHILNGQVEHIDLDDALLLSGCRDKKAKTRFKSLVYGNERDRKKIAAEILDRHGTGRVIFRNTRSAIGWFPKRLEKLYPLEATSEKVRLADLELENQLNADEKSVSCEGKPDHQPDYRNDPRISFLMDLQKQLPDEKILVICRTPEMTTAIKSAVKSRMNIKIALFNENMTLIQRDRNAAWFSESQGASLMICSEIGSEGRNFQFAQHMVMFDLPLNPELLEQRLGRLDRIGQTRDIFIHVPYIKGSASEILVNWFSRGLDIFKNNISGLYFLYKEFGPRVADLIRTKIKTSVISESALSELVNETIGFRKALSEKFETGRNRILELSSFHADRAKKLTDKIASIDKSRDLDDFMGRIFDYYGIRTDEIAERTWKLHFNDLTGSEFPVPALGESRKTVTFDRKKALVRVEIDFLSWDHPMVTGAMELLLGAEKGNSSLAVWNDSGRQGILLEAVYSLECVAPCQLHMDRFLPSDALRLVVDSSGNDVSETYPFAVFEQNLENFAGSWLLENPEIGEILLPQMIAATTETAERSAAPVIESAIAEINSVMGDEIRRLKDLKKANPDIRDEEISSLEHEKQALCGYISQARFRLDALRLVLLT